MNKDPNNTNENEWEEIKEYTRTLKDAAGLIFGAIFWGFMIMMGIWAFLEAIFQITLTFVQAVLITVGIFLIVVVKSWWSSRYQKEKPTATKQ